MAFDVSAFLRGYKRELMGNKVQLVLNACPATHRGEVAQALMEWGVDILKHMSSIPEQCFANSNIVSITIPENIESIGEGAFSNCTRLSHVMIEDGVSIIDRGAFMGCTALSSVDLPDTIERIPQDCFRFDGDLIDFYIPESVKVIGLNAFEGCNSIKLTTPYRERRVDKLRVKSSDEEFFKGHLIFTHATTQKVEGLTLDESLFEEADTVVIDAENKEELVEAFSDSMPDWLKKRFIRGKGDKAAQKLTKNDPLRASIKGRTDEVDLFYEFLKHGIDLNSVDIIHEGGIPTSSRDPRLKDPYIPIFLVKSKAPYAMWIGNDRLQAGDDIYQVYAKGINDSEVFLGSDDMDTKFGYVSMKKLLPNVVDFCYIDSSKLGTELTDKRLARANMKAELNKLKDYFRETNPDVIKGNRGYRWRPQYDASGYLKDPHKYDAKLAELKKKNYSRVINQLRDRLVEAKTDIVSLMSEIDLEKIANSTLNIDGIRNALGELREAQSYYEEMCKTIEKALAESNEYYRDSYFQNALGNRGYSWYADRALSSLEERLAPYKNVILDW